MGRRSPLAPGRRSELWPSWRSMASAPSPSIYQVPMPLRTMRLSPPQTPRAPRFPTSADFAGRGRLRAEPRPEGHLWLGAIQGGLARRAAGAGCPWAPRGARLALHERVSAAASDGASPRKGWTTTRPGPRVVSLWQALCIRTFAVPYVEKYGATRGLVAWVPVAPVFPHQSAWELPEDVRRGVGAPPLPPWCPLYPAPAAPALTTHQFT